MGPAQKGDRPRQKRKRNLLKSAGYWQSFAVYQCDLNDWNTIVLQTRNIHWQEPNGYQMPMCTAIFLSSGEECSLQVCSKSISTTHIWFSFHLSIQIGRKALRLDHASLTGIQLIYMALMTTLNPGRLTSNSFQFAIWSVYTAQACSTMLFLSVASCVIISRLWIRVLLSI